MADAASLDDEVGRAAFLERPRYGTLITNRREGTPMGVPVWFDWDGTAIRMFAAGTTSKVKRLRRDPRASLLVANRFGEQEGWIAFDGEVEISEEGGFELAEKLAPRYWDLEDPERAATFDLWRQARAALVLLTLVPSRIRNGS